MATLWNSSIQPWLELGRNQNLTLPHCTKDSLIVSCAQVCNDSTVLFQNQSSNLVTCGIWTTIVAASGANESNNPFDPDPLNLMPAFASHGLVPSIYQYTASYADTISDCLGFIYHNIKEWSFADNGDTAAACTRNDLFPILTQGPVSSTIRALDDCLNSICSPLTMNPDLAGIGVFSSFIIQSGIAVLALVALVGFEVWSQIKRLPEEQSKTHINSLVIALVEFHKAQCYFSSVIQITALALFRQSTVATNNAYSSSPADKSNDIFDTSILIVLATSGLIPVNLILTCIMRYGRYSWYLLILSLITTILATSTLIASYHYTHAYGKPYAWYQNDLGDAFDDSNAYGGGISCTINADPENTILSLCGNSKLVNNSLPAGLIDNRWTWAVWANCIIWLFLGLGIKCYNLKVFARHREKLTQFGTKVSFIRCLIKNSRTYTTWIVVSVIPWSLCIAGQLYLFSAFLEHSVISYDWSFGQIIAVTVWLPSTVEYIYIEWNGIMKASKYKYPAPLKVTGLHYEDGFDLPLLPTSGEVSET
ncbi:hypothetical protein BDR22DRAFT_394050 [Usnea florida]